MDRIVGVLTLKAPVYRQIAEDGSATRTAAIIVAIVSLVTGVAGAVVISIFGSQLAPFFGGSASNPIVQALQTIILGLAGWGIGSWVMGFVAKLLGGKTSTGAMLRVFGYASIFYLLGVIPCLGLIGVLLAIFAAVLGVREAAGVSTGKAILIGVVGFIAIFIVSVIIATILGFILGPLGIVV